MRVGMVVQGGVDESGEYRVIPALLALIERIAHRNELTVVALQQEPEPRSYPLQGARIVNLGLRPRWFPGHRILNWQRGMSAYLSQHKQPFDLMHALWLGPTSTLAIRAAQRLRIPVVASVLGGEMVALRDIQYGGSLGWSMRLQARYALSKATIVTAPSQYAFAPVQRIRPDARILTLFPDITSFTPQTESRGSGPPWRLLTVSTVNRVKDPLMLLKAVRWVVDRMDDVHLDWVGEDILAGEVQREIELLGLRQHVTFHGFKPYRLLPEYYGRAHVYVQASRFESAGVAVCEAAAAGLALVGTRVGLMAEMPSDCALTSNPGESTALAESILHVLGHDDLRQTLADNARSWVESRTADTTFAQCEGIYTHAIERAR